MTQGGWVRQRPCLAPLLELGVDRLGMGRPEGGPNAVAAWPRGRSGGEWRWGAGGPWPTPERAGQRQPGGGQPFSSSFTPSNSRFAAAEPPRGSMGAQAAARRAGCPTDSATMSVALPSAARRPPDASLRVAGGLLGAAGPSSGQALATRGGRAAATRPTDGHRLAAIAALPGSSAVAPAQARSAGHRSMPSSHAPRPG